MLFLCERLSHEYEWDAAVRGQKTAAVGAT